MNIFWGSILDISTIFISFVCFKRFFVIEYKIVGDKNEER